jgi:hypothetical protein
METNNIGHSKLYYEWQSEKRSRLAFLIVLVVLTTITFQGVGETLSDYILSAVAFAK